MSGTSAATKLPDLRSVPVKTSPYRQCAGELADYWPDIGLHEYAIGYKLLVQLRLSRKVSKGGIIKPDDTKRIDSFNATVGLVLSIGDTAFRDRKTGEPWAGGPWPQVGDFIRVPLHGLDRHFIDWGKDKDPLYFCYVTDEDVKGIIPADAALERHL